MYFTQKLKYNATMLIILLTLSGILTIGLAVYGGILTTANPRRQKWFICLGTLGGLLVLAQGYYLYHDDHEKNKTMSDLKDSVKKLQEQTTALSNGLNLQASLDDFRHLETVIVNGFNHLEEVIRGTKPPRVPSEQAQPPLGPAVVEGLRVIQRRAASSNPNAKFGLQVVMQTNTTEQPVAFRIECDQEITDGNAFIVGEGVYTMFATSFSGDHKSFSFSFHTPAFTPDSSLMVVLQSRYDIRITKIEKIRPLF